MQHLLKEQSAGYLANHMARLFRRLMNNALEPLGLSTGQLGILLELWKEDGLTQNELVARLDHEQATIANTLSRMERDGLIRRKPLASDKRARTIHLTAKARSLESDVGAQARTVNAKALGALSPAERKAFLAMIERVVEAQKKALDEFAK